MRNGAASVWGFAMPCPPRASISPVSTATIGVFACKSAGDIGGYRGSGAVAKMLGSIVM